MGGGGTLFVGEDKTLRIKVNDVNNVPVDIAGWVILLDIRAKDTSADPAIFAATASITGVYNVSPSSNTQRAVVQMTDDNLNLFKQKVYRYSWKRMDAGNETVLMWGDFTPEKATAP
jgi:hypothetical protein